MQLMLQSSLHQKQAPSTTLSSIWVTAEGFSNVSQGGRFLQTDLDKFMGRICSGFMVAAVHLLDGAKQEACRVSHTVMYVSLSVNAWTHLCLQTCKMITNDHGSTRRTVQLD